jgi:hypothetical protein
MNARDLAPFSLEPVARENVRPRAALLGKLDQDLAVIPSRYLLGICLTLLGGSIASPAAAQPALVVNDVSVTEPTGGTALATFTVAYTDGQPHGATIIFVTTPSGQSSTPSAATGGTGCSGNVDYISVNNVGHTFTTASTTFTVTVCGDAHDEADQQFLVNVTARGATVQDGQGIATLVDDDATPVFSVTSCAGRFRQPDRDAQLQPGEEGAGDSRAGLRGRRHRRA